MQNKACFITPSSVQGENNYNEWYSPRDDQNEAKIASYFQFLILAKTRQDKFYAWGKMQDGIMNRSQRQIQKMEKRMGLYVR